MARNSSRKHRFWWNAPPTNVIRESRHRKDHQYGKSFGHIEKLEERIALTVAESEPNDVLLEADSLVVESLIPVQAAGEGLFSAVGAGGINTSDDVDVWLFDANAGDVITVAVDSIGESLDTFVEILNGAGTVITSDENSGPGLNSLTSSVSADFIGQFFVRVSGRSSTVGDYSVRVDIARGINLETDQEYANDINTGADFLTYRDAGTIRNASVAGTIMAASGASTDEDRFRLGLLNAGTVVDLEVLTPEATTLTPAIRVFDTNGTELVDADGNSSNGFSAVVTEDQTYFAEVSAASGAGPSAQYVLDVSITDAIPPRIDAVTVDGFVVSQGTVLAVLPSTFSATLSEALDASTVDHPWLAEHDGRAYLLTTETMTLAEARALAGELGGNLVDINDASEQDFLTRTFGFSDFWIGLSDEATEGTHVWDSGATLSFTNWAPSEPGNNDGVYLDGGSGGSIGRWRDSSPTSSRRAVIEIVSPGSDGDGDGLNDANDPLPADALNGFELREAGIDGVFDTADDQLRLLNVGLSGLQLNFEVLDGPLLPGSYRLTVTPSLSDVLGNPLDGDRNGTGGDAFVRTFSVDVGEGFTLEGIGNRSFDTAVELLLTEDPNGTGLFRAASFGRGSIDPGNDYDYFRFSGRAGDRLAINVDKLGGAFDPTVQLFQADGTSVASDFSFTGPGSTAFISGAILLEDGDYFIEVADRFNDEMGDYQVRVDLARGIQMETDQSYSNDANNASDSLAFSDSGTIRTATIAGAIMAPEGLNQDEDRFRLGLLNAGTQIDLATALPSWSTLTPELRVFDSMGVELFDEDGDGSNGFQAMVASDETYYAEIASAFWSFDGSRYVLGDTSPTFADAQAFAESLGGNLVTINSQAEQDFLFDVFSQGTSDFWIGLNDVTTEGTYEWVSGELLSFTNWADGEPNNTAAGRSDADGIFFDTATGEWFDYPTFFGLAPLAEIPDAVAPSFSGAGALAQYVLQVTLSDLVPPRLEQVDGLPEEGEVTDELISSFSATLSEALDASTVDHPWLAEHDGSAYLLTTDTMTLTEARALAGELGGHVVDINDEAEQDFLTRTFGFSDFWIGLSDEVAEGTHVWDSGVSIEFTNWAANEPGSNDGVYLDGGSGGSIGRWRDSSLTSSRRAVIEIVSPGTDGDGDGLNDANDPLPADALNGFELREAGIDGVFDTADDQLRLLNVGLSGLQLNFEVLDGPMLPGSYRFSVTPSLTDVLGNPLDGDRNGTGGDAFVRTFSVDVGEGFALEGVGNRSFDTAVELLLTEDPNGTGLFRAASFGRGSIDPGNDYDYFRFSGRAGDRLAINVDKLGGAFDPTVQLFQADGTSVASDFSFTGPGSTAFISGAILLEDGDYFIEVADRFNDEMGDYQVRVDLARGIQMETDQSYSNDTSTAADGLSFAESGPIRTATVAGAIMSPEGTNQDEDRFRLGLLNAGTQVNLASSLPSWSTLTPVLRVFDSTGAELLDEDADASNGFQAIVVNDETYFAQVSSAYWSFNGSRYVLGDTSPTFTDAQSFAESLGGNLVSINSQDEQDFLFSFFQGTNSFWIGLNDTATEGTHEWISGEPVTYTNWADGEPNNVAANRSDADGAFFNPQTGEWFDYPTFFGLTPLVEVSDATTPAESGPGPLAQYVLEVTLSDLVPPRVEQVVGLPEEGEVTNALISTFTATVSEAIDSTTVNRPWLAEYNDRTYLRTQEALTLADAQTLAAELGGHVVDVNDAAEQDFLARTFGFSDFWIGLSDESVEGTHVWDSGEPLSYTNWADGEPGSQDGVFLDGGSGGNIGRWRDSSTTTTRQAVVEIVSPGVDSDSDGLNNANDPLPLDALNGFELREAGVDGLFDTADDQLHLLNVRLSGLQLSFEVLDGPLLTGNYRLTATPSLTDILGNPLDGDRNGVGGDTFVRTFTVDVGDGFTLEGIGNRGFDTAVELTLTEDASGTGLFRAESIGRGSVDPSSDYDYFWFSGQTGDRVAINVDKLGGAFDPTIQLFQADGSSVASDFSFTGPGSTAFISGAILPEDGDYFIEVADRFNDETGDYQVRVDLARGIQMETDQSYSNDESNAADSLAFSESGPTRTAMVAGTIMSPEGTNQDEDRFRLGLLNAGTQVDLAAALPSWSTLTPELRVFDSLGVELLDVDDDASNGFQATVIKDETYFAEISSAFWSFDGSRYVLGDTSPTFNDAQSFAESIGGDLVTINSQAEQDFLQRFLRGANSFWIGLNDVTTEGVHEWISGEPVSYTNWADGEPNNVAVNRSDADGVFFNPQTGEWFDYPTFFGLTPLVEIADATAPAESGAGPLAQYVLELTLSDLVPPRIESLNGLPGEAGTTGELISTFSATLSEALDPSTVDHPWLAEHDGRAYLLTTETMTLAEARTLADELGGHVVDINDEAEQDFLTRTFGFSDFWIGLSDEVTEGTHVWDSGVSVDFTNWAESEPGSDDGVYLDGGSGENIGRWRDSSPTSSRRAVIEIVSPGTDGDGDGLNDENDPLPADALNGFELREAGIDGVFDTADDQLRLINVGLSGLQLSFVVLDGPLLPGNYRLTVTASLSDVLGNPLDGTATSTSRELILNPSGEETTAGGELLGWTEVLGADWQQRSANPEPFDGESYFFPGVAADAELSQEVDVSEFAAGIDDGVQRFDFSAWTRSFDQPTPDTSRVVIEYLDAGSNLLDSHDTGLTSSVTEWVKVEHSQIAPIGTRVIKVRLISDRNAGSNNDGYFDNLSLRTRVDGTDGDAFMRTFSVDVGADFALEGVGNRSFDTAVELTLTEDPSGTGLFRAESLGRGSIDPGNDYDYFRFSGQAGDRVAINVDKLEGAFDPTVQLFRADGTSVASDFSFTGPGSTAFISGVMLPEDGDYFIEVADRFNDEMGDYQVRVDLARGIQMETDQSYTNDPQNSPDFVQLSPQGDRLTATVAGGLMADEGATEDRDAFSIGAIESGKTVIVRMRLPDSSTLVPGVQILDSNLNLLSQAPNPNETTDVRTELTTDTGILVVVSGLGGEGPLGNYLLDIFVVDTIEFADLDVTDVTAANAATAGDTIAVNWTVGNFGTAATDVASWTDSVVLSSDAIFGNNDDVVVATERYEGGSLPVSQTYDAQTQVTLPSGIEGNYYLFVATDTGQEVFEFLFDGNNDGGGVPIAINPPPMPDLIVEAPAGPSSAKFGDTINIGWTVRNTGAAQASGGWSDRIYLSSDSVLDDADMLLLTQPGTAAALAPGATYSQSVSAQLPLDFELAEGEYFLIIVADGLSEQFEEVESNNTAALAIQLTQPPRPDLVVTGTMQPAEVIQGRNTVFNWTVRNAGDADFTGSFREAVYLSSDDAPGGDILIGEFLFNGTLPAGQSVERAQVIEVPGNLVGDYFVVVRTDLDNDVNESSELNNVTVSDESIAILTTPTPNLIVESINRPSTAFSEQEIQVSWVVRNTGTASTNVLGWTDYVYLSLDDTLDGNDVLLGSSRNTSYLNPGDAYTGTLAAVLPRGIENNYRIIVATDQFDQVEELTNEGDNTRASQQFTVNLTPPPDLVVDAVSATSQVFSGTTFQIGWTVRNQGTGSTRGVAWTDQVFLSFNGDTIDAEDMLVASVPQFGELDPEGTYTVSDISIATPFAASGTAHVIVRTNALEQVYEHVFDFNNDGSRSTEVLQSPAPDLVVTDLSAPGNAFAGQPFTVQYVVTNEGANATPVASWSDAIYLSTDDQLDPETDMLLGNRFRSGVLDLGESETQTHTFTLPNTLTGEFYVFVVSDTFNAVFESDDDNNTRVSAERVSVAVSPPDLRVTAASSNSQPRGGREFVVDYTVVNAGPVPTPNNVWFDAYFLSDDATLDASDISLGSRRRTGVLASGQQESLSVATTLPAGEFGSRFLLIVSDATNQVFELDNENNLFALPLTITDDRPDLQLTSFNPRVTGGQVLPGGTITFDYSVANIGVGPTYSSTWRDNLVLSADDILGNSDDIQLGSFDGPASLAPSASYSRASLNVAVPFGTPAGTYRLFLSTDSVDAMTESDESNNTLSFAPLVVGVASPTEAADLVVDSVVAPATALSGETLSVSWQVSNAGTRRTPVSLWTDRVWLSTDTTVGPDDLMIGSIRRTEPLEAGASYSRTLNYELDVDLEGDFYVIVQTDFGNAVAEGAFEGNNESRSAAPIAISLNPTPDLVVTSITAPSTASSGRTFDLSWTVENTGPGTAEGNWFDSVYLSLDPIFDRATDISIGYVDRSTPVAPNGSYTGSGTFSVPPALGGPYYLFVVTDSTDRLFERDGESNNVLGADGSIEIVHIPPADLVVGEITIPASGVPGQDATITFTVNNTGLNPATGSWSDAIYLSADETWDINDAFFGRVTHSGNVLAGESYTSTLTAPLPGVLPGDYHVIVRSDILNNLPESDETNNLSASLDSFAVDVAELTLGTPVAGQIADDQSVYYRVDVELGETLVIELDQPSADSSVELYVRFDDLPSRSLSDFSDVEPYSTDQRVIVPITRAGTYYILAFGTDIDAESLPFNLVARTVDFSVLDTDFGTLGATSSNQTTQFVEGEDLSGLNTIRINGAKFTGNTTATLVLGDLVIPAVSYWMTDTSTLYATFDLQGTPGNEIPLGEYDLRVSDPIGGTVMVADSVEVIANTRNSGRITTRFEGADSVQINLTHPVDLLIGNTSTADTYAPLVTLSSERLGTPFGFSPTNMSVQTVQLLAINDNGPAGIYRAGDTATVPLFFRPGQLDAAIDIGVITAQDRTPIDWSARKDELRPLTISTEAWDVIYSNLVGDIPTWGEFVIMLNENATHLSRLGQRITDVSSLWNFEVLQAMNALTPLPELASSLDASLISPGLQLELSRTFSAALTDRYSTGWFGRGWSTRWDIHLAVEDTGEVVIYDSTGPTRLYVPDVETPGRYIAEPGDTSTILFSDGQWLLQETDGLKTVFTQDGRLLYLQDANANRIDATYDNASLVRLTHSSGEWLALSFSDNARLASIEDSGGRVTSYTYDATGRFLLQATGPDGIPTRYSYDTSEDTNRFGSLLSIERAGSIQAFSYDERGRLAATSLNDSTSSVAYAYDDSGRVTISDASSSVDLFYDMNGSIPLVYDAFGQATKVTFNSERRLEELINPLGQSQLFTWCECGALESHTDEGGNTTQYTYVWAGEGATLRRLGTYSDANGNVTSHTYDNHGNLLRTDYPDGSYERYGDYDVFGNPHRYTDRRGYVTTFEYNSRGQILREAFEDGSWTTYSYDARSNLLQISQDTGSQTTFLYDTADRLNEVQFDTGEYLKYTYDSAGRQASIKDQDGFAVYYAYDAIGRLHEVRDASDALVASYMYDELGRLMQTERANGITSIRTFDEASRLLSLSNQNSSGDVVSAFQYDYDVLGRRTGQHTVHGSWAYDYDATGNLVSAVFAPRETQPINAVSYEYAYDGVGNRVSTALNGVITNYAINNLNQYVQIGADTYEYDANGNLVKITSGDSVSTYTYDVRNFLTEASEAGDVWAFEYDVWGNTTAREFNGQRSEYVNDYSTPTNLLFREHVVSSGAKTHFVYGNFLEAAHEASSGTTFFTYDAIGTVANLTSAGGDVVGEFAYDPFGELLLSTSGLLADVRFVGAYGVRSSTGELSLMGERHYSSQMGRFVAVDPIGISGGINVYSYVTNDPLRYIDNEGLRGVPPAQRAPWPRQPVPRSHRPRPQVDPYMRRVEERRNFWENVGDFLEYLVTPDLCFDALQKNNACKNHPGEEVLYANCQGVGIITRCPGDPLPPLPDEPLPPLFPSDPWGDLPPWNPPVTVPRSSDPNDILGPDGVGEEKWISVQDTLNYTIRYENDPEMANAPAQVVRITQTLDDDLDPRSFRLGDFGFGDLVFEVPNNRAFYATRLDLRDRFGIFIDVAAGVDVGAGEVFWELVSIDPQTGEIPLDRFIGFLPPNVTAPEGDGFVTYTIRPEQAAPNGARIDAEARIFFDENAPIDTPPIFNTIDALTPDSSVASITSPVGDQRIPVSWAGGDGDIGSGLSTYDVFVRANDGEYALWLADTELTSAEFLGETGTRYGFYSIARDAVGNLEATPAMPDAEVVTAGPPAMVVDSFVQEGAIQRSYVDTWSITFDREMGLQQLIDNGTIASAFTLTNLGVDAGAAPDTVIPLSASQFAYSSGSEDGSSQLIWSLDSFAGSNQSLADGYYQTEVDGNLLLDLAGIALDGNGDGNPGGVYGFAFHRLQGDVNGNMTVDGDDMQAVNSALGARPISDSWDINADLDRDGRITVRDRVTVARATGTEILPEVAQAPLVASLTGDFNNDNVVNAADYTVWRDNYGSTSPVGPVAGDADGDNDVDGADFLAWQRNFGATANPIATAEAEVQDAAVPVSNTLIEEDYGEQAGLDGWTVSFGLTSFSGDDNADLDHDKDVDGADFLQWQREFVAPAAPTAVHAAKPISEAARIAFSIGDELSSSAALEQSIDELARAVVPQHAFRPTNRPTFRREGPSLKEAAIENFVDNPTLQRFETFARPIELRDSLEVEDMLIDLASQDEEESDHDAIYGDSEFLEEVVPIK